MGVERQQGSGKQQDFFDEALKASLGHDVTGKGGTGAGTIEERQSPTAWAEPLALTRYVMEEVASSANLNQAYKRVKANKGAPGVDGMTVPDLRDWIAGNRERLIASLLDGTYRPSLVRGVEIPKPGGKGVRQLGIPTAVDRLVQQAILQVLDPVLDPTFSASSFGFRPALLRKCPRDSVGESSWLGGGDEQTAPRPLPHDELEVLQRSAGAERFASGLV
ncbi:hypothetical protein [Novosphingobium decolorationis]|uniref:hypothetical protein n=1 Tax=Novosphingobium decolorationis TaxID=2698673 RepID=UPI001BCE72D0|nr:hypothetical protein [Novosphingobium decolorationis]